MFYFLHEVTGTWAVTGYLHGGERPPWHSWAKIGIFGLSSSPLLFAEFFPYFFPCWVGDATIKSVFNLWLWNIVTSSCRDIVSLLKDTRPLLLFSGSRPRFSTLIQWNGSRRDVCFRHGYLTKNLQSFASNLWTVQFNVLLLLTTMPDCSSPN